MRKVQQPGPASAARHQIAPWLHCHGIWRDAHGQTAAGHILPNETYIAKPVSAQLTFVHDADFMVLPCVETGFSLFHPIEASSHR